MRFSEEEPDHVCGDVVDGDDGHRDDVPDHAGQGGQVHQVTGHAQEQDPHVGPSQHGVPAQQEALVSF